MVRSPDAELIERQRAAIEPLNNEGFDTYEIARRLGIPRNRVCYVMKRCKIKSVCGRGNKHGRSKAGGGGIADPAQRERDRREIEPLIAMAYTIKEVAEALGLRYSRVDYIMRYYSIASQHGRERPAKGRTASGARFDFEDTDEL